MVSLTNGGGLANWVAATESRYYAPAKVLVIGDSTSEGVITTTPTYLNRWQYLLQQALRAALPTPGLEAPGVGYMPALYADSLIADETTKTGTPGEILTQWGLGLKCVTVNPSQTVVWPAITCQRIRVWYGKSNFLAGGGKVLVDGVDQGVTLSSVAGANSDGFVWDSAALTLGSHTITLQGNTANRFFADAVEFYTSAADLTSGIRVYDAAHSGARVSTYLTGVADDGHWQAVATLKPQLVVIMLGINDWGNDSPATYTTNLTTMLSKVATAMGTVPYSVLLVTPYRPVKTNGATYADWAGYLAGARSLATGNVAHYDLQEDWPILVPNGGTATGIMYEDAAPVHPNYAGHARIGSLLTQILTPSRATYRIPVGDSYQLNRSRTYIPRKVPQ